MHTSADKAQVQADRVRRKREKRAADIRAMMESESNREVLAGFLYDVCGLKKVDAPLTAEQLAFDAGRRSVARDLIADLQSIAPEGYAALERERIAAENYEASLQAAHAVPASGDRKAS